MDKRYQGVIRRRKSMKDRQNNGLKIPRGNKKAYINEGQKNNGQRIPRGNKKAYINEGQINKWTKDTRG
jgi:hypothetical protein